MKRLANIFWLGTKELRSLQRDTVLVVFVLYAFTLRHLHPGEGDVVGGPQRILAFVDEDQSALSKRLFESFYPPRFKHPQTIKADEVDRLMDHGTLHVRRRRAAPLRGRPPRGPRPEIQVNIDATAMQQASIGAGYIRNILTDQVLRFLQRSDAEPRAPRLDRRPQGLQPQRRHVVVHEHRRHHQPDHHAHHDPDRGRADPRARARHDRAPAGHAAHGLRDRDGQGLGQRPGRPPGRRRRRSAWSSGRSSPSRSPARPACSWRASSSTCSSRRPWASSWARSPGPWPSSPC